MVYIETIEDEHALIFNGPVTYEGIDPKILTSANLAEVSGSWEFNFLPNQETEWPALEQNAVDYLERIERLTNLPQSESRILDFGSGWGFFLAIAKKRGWIPYGLEPLPASYVFARATFGLDITTNTLQENTFPPAYFDIITSFQVFEHLPDPGKDLKILHHSLRQGGTLVIEVPCFEMWKMKILRSRYRHFVQDHLNFFTRETLSKLLTDNGFEVTGHYHPKRRMSMSHLSRFWFRRYLPDSLYNVVQHSLRKTSLWNQMINLNLGDIVTVMGCKR